jgi:hypothetical protein
MIYLHTIPEVKLSLVELINRYPLFVADRIQYDGWELEETAMELLVKKLDKQSVTQILRRKSKHFTR